ncbi:MAG: hypothetical protein ACRET9_05795, partial [Burkholderiales bacterium]
MGKKIKQRNSEGFETEFAHHALINRGAALILSVKIAQIHHYGNSEALLKRFALLKNWIGSQFPRTS